MVNWKRARDLNCIPGIPSHVPILYYPALVTTEKGCPNGFFYWSMSKILLIHNMGT